MMKNLIRLVLIAATLTAFSLITNAQTIGGSIAGGKVTRGKAAKATVTLSIPGGLHVNSNRTYS
jgi:hypothetical protein